MLNSEQAILLDKINQLMEVKTNDKQKLIQLLQITKDLIEKQTI